RGAQLSRMKALKGPPAGRLRCSALCCFSLIRPIVGGPCRTSDTASVGVTTDAAGALPWVVMTQHPPGTPARSEVTGPQRISRRQLAPASGLGRHLRDAAIHVVRTDSPPTVALGLRSEGDRDVSQQHARSVIDLALRVGEAMLSTGAPAADSVATVLRLANAYGVGSVHVDVTYTSISVSIHRGLEEDSLTVMRVIPARSPDYTRLEGVQQLIDDIIGSAGAGGATLDVLSARERLLAVLTSPHPYRRW